MHIWPRSFFNCQSINKLFNICRRLEEANDVELNPGPKSPRKEASLVGQVIGEGGGNWEAEGRDAGKEGEELKKPDFGGIGKNVPCLINCY